MTTLTTHPTTTWGSGWNPVSAIKPALADYFVRLFQVRYPGAADQARLDKAAQIMALAGACKRGDQPNTYLVKAGSRAGWYTVDLNTHTCTCPDARAGNLCKHRLSIGCKLYGPDWAVPAQRAHARAVTDAYADLGKALDQLADAATTLQDLAHRQESGHLVSESSIESARAESAHLADIVEGLERRYNTLRDTQYPV